MAIAPLTAAMKPIKTAGLFDASQSGGLSFDDWMKKNGNSSAFPSIAPAQVNDSMADKVTALTKTDSPLMQAARTEGLKAANRRGMLNSSIAAGASQAASLAAVLPIASQDSAQDFQRNAAARQFEYGMAAQDDQQSFVGGQAALDRALSERMQGKDIASREKLALAQIASTEGLAAAQRELDLRMQTNALNAADRQQIRQIASTEGLAAADRALQQKLQATDVASREKLALAQIAATQGIEAARNALEREMQGAALAAADRQQLRDIAARQGIAAAERELQTKLQAQDIAFRTQQGALDRQSAATLQQHDIKFRENLASLDRDLQTKIAQWNLDSSDRNAAVQTLVNFENLYSTQVQNINANTALSAAQRTEQLKSARAYRDEMIDFVQQMYDVDIQWNTSTPKPTTPAPKPTTPAPTPTTPKPATPTPSTPSTPAPSTPPPRWNPYDSSR